jgi:hypothetical protein
MSSVISSHSAATELSASCGAALTDHRLCQPNVQNIPVFRRARDAQVSLGNGEVEQILAISGDVGLGICGVIAGIAS